MRDLNIDMVRKVNTNQDECITRQKTEEAERGHVMHSSLKERLYI